MLAGLSNPTHASQQAFRAMLKAMSEPATLVDIDVATAWENLNSASVGVLLTLCDQNTTLYFSDALHNESVIKSTQFHTQAVVGEAHNAHFAFITSSEFDADDYYHGDETYPEHSATVIIQVDSLTDGQPLTLSGAGIETTKVIAPSISDALLAHYQRQTERYPLGIDTILTCGNQLMAIPRTTNVEAQ